MGELLILVEVGAGREQGQVLGGPLLPGPADPIAVRAPLPAGNADKGSHRLLLRQQGGQGLRVLPGGEMVGVIQLETADGEGRDRSVGEGEAGHILMPPGLPRRFAGEQEE